MSKTVADTLPNAEGTFLFQLKSVVYFCCFRVKHRCYSQHLDDRTHSPQVAIGLKLYLDPFNRHYFHASAILRSCSKVTGSIQ